MSIYQQINLKFSGYMGNWMNRFDMNFHPDKYFWDTIFFLDFDKCHLTAQIIDEVGFYLLDSGIWIKTNIHTKFH